jgi:hypothetical protein
MQELEAQLQEQAPHNAADHAHLHELPPLVIDGIPTPIDKMTQVGTKTNKQNEQHPPPTPPNENRGVGGGRKSISSTMEDPVRITLHR